MRQPPTIYSADISKNYENDGLQHGHQPREMERTLRPSRADTLVSSTKGESNSTNEKSNMTSPPPLSFSPWDKRTSIIFCTCAILFFDLVMPCILYYTLHSLTNLDIEVILGISCACLGLGELLELPLRGYRLVRHRENYAPLDQTAKWGFDFVFWWYLVATVIGIVPYVISTSLEEPILWLFLMTPGLLVGFAVLTALISMVPFELPCRISSDVKGERCKPFAYYVVEDFVAVDAGQGRAYRKEIGARWRTSSIFRRLMWDMNVWWTVGGVLFIGVLAGMTWGMEFSVAYGLSFGLLFVWIGLWALGSWLWVLRRLRQERVWFERIEVRQQS